MAIGIDGKEKPVYTEGQRVDFDFDGKVKGIGRIRGKASEHIIDAWIVEVEESTIDKGTYPWSCLVVPHPQLKVHETSPAELDRLFSEV